uniref:Uncharacterized protein n=1 Tax=Candidatus Kentrum sp. DK TaxID=2126562 RepID=A0A450SZE9_9GAMM|nr:MAG: hypothetical protein BECKDK2373B_GA0170837_108419 [Candidatus Kentron sp. DK]
MLDEITNHLELSGLLRPRCKENDVCVTVCDELLENGLLRHDLIAILKIDAYFSSKRIHNPSQSIDCLIIIKTGEREFGLTLVELRKAPTSGRARRLKSGVIKPKFDNTIAGFLSNGFADIFMNPDFTISYFRLWVVSNRYGSSLSSEQERKKARAARLEADMKNECKFMGKIFPIQRMSLDQARVCTDLT